MIVGAMFAIAIAMTTGAAAAGNATAYNSGLFVQYCHPDTGIPEGLSQFFVPRHCDTMMQWVEHEPATKAHNATWRLCLSKDQDKCDTSTCEFPNTVPLGDACTKGQRFYGVEMTFQQTPLAGDSAAEKASALQVGTFTNATCNSTVADLSGAMDKSPVYALGKCNSKRWNLLTLFNAVDTTGKYVQVCSFNESACSAFLAASPEEQFKTTNGDSCMVLRADHCGPFLPGSSSKIIFVGVADNTLWYIIGGAAGGVVLLACCGVFLARRKKRKSYQAI